MDHHYLTILNGADDATPRSVAKELEEGDLEMYAARFINGLVHQAHHQTGHARPIGQTTAVRVAQELFVLANTLKPTGRPLDMEKVLANLRLDAYADAPAPAAAETTRERQRS